ncbi:MAG: hypothetical protein KF861_02155 [Planctomycetaceae bacterium]|nr:hypothetical protein [Planctomycetaceae bacterium]
MAQNVREKLLLQRTAERLGIAEEVVHQQYTQLRRRENGPQRSLPTPERAVRRIDRAETPGHVTRILQGQPTRDDRLEYELLQCLVAGLQWTGLVRREIGSGDFTNPALRNIAQACFDIDESGVDSLAFTRLMSALDDDPAAKQLAVWLETQAVSKRIDEHLCETAKSQEANTTDDCPLLLRRCLREIQWRREEQSHKRMALELSEQCEGARSLDAETERLLRRFSDFHQKRATK